MKVRKGLAAFATTAMAISGIGVISGSAVAAEGDRYVPESQIIMTTTPEEESDNYNVWHYDPSSVDSGAVQQRNGLLVNAGERILIAEGNGNDVVAAGEDLADGTTIEALGKSLDIVTSDPASVHYQIPVFFNAKEDGSWDFTTLRKAANQDNDSWVSSANVDINGDGTFEIVSGAKHRLSYLANTLNNWDDARPIAVGFLVDGVSTDVLISSFTANGATTRFYEEPGTPASYSGETEVLVDTQIRPDETTYPDWHQGYATLGDGDSFETVREDGVPAGLKLTGTVQILNGFAEEDFLTNAADLAQSLQVDVTAGDGEVWVQVPLFVYEEGVNAGDDGEQFTTLRAVVPDSGDLADATGWTSSWEVKNAAGEVIVPKDEELTFAEIADAIGDHDVIGYGFLTNGGTATVKSVTFDGVKTRFYQDPAVWTETEEYVPLADITPTYNPEEETQFYNEWHFDPSSTIDQIDSARNGLIVPAGARALIVEGNGNDVIGPRGVLADTTTVTDLVASLDVVASDADAVHYQIPIFFNADADGNWGFTTLRQSASGTTDLWTTSGAIGDIPKNSSASLDDIVAALNAYGDARIISVGFLVDEPADDVLVSSFSAKDKTTYFYDGAMDSDGYTADTVVVESDEIRPDEETYPGWHEGYADPDLGTYETVYEGPRANGLEVNGTVQILNGFEEAAFLQNAIGLAKTLKVDVAAGDDPVWAQIPVFSYQDGVYGEQFTTIRGVVPENGDMSGVDTWISSWNIKDAAGNLLLEKDVEYTFDEIQAGLGKHEVLGYGFLVHNTSAAVTVNSVTFDQSVTSFVGEHVAVTPDAPTQFENVVTIPLTTGVDYQVDGVTVDGAVDVTYDGGDVVVTAVPQVGYVIADEAVSTWTFAYIDIPVTAEAPTFADNEITIPTVDNVIYLIEGVEVAGDIELLPGQSATVTAEGAPGYVVEGDSSWTFTYVNAQVVPPTPDFTDNIITIPTAPSVEYLIDGTVWTGTYLVPIGETVTVTAQGTAGYTVIGTSEWDFTYVAVEVTPTAPTQDGNDVTIPELTGVEYVVGDEVATGTLQIDLEGSLTVTARATDGYVLEDGATSTWVFEYVPVEVTPAAPTQDGNTVTIPVTFGVDYQINGNSATGDFDITYDEGTLVVTAEATSGYVLAADATTTWSFDYIPVEVTPAAPTQDGNVVTIPEMVGVEYLVGDEVVTETVEIEVDSTLAVTAQATAGYVLADGATASWSFDYVPTVVKPEAPTQDGNVVTIPEMVGVEYLVGDEVVTDTVEIAYADDELVVTVRAIAGYELADDATASWTFGYEPVEVTPAAPTQDGNVVTIPEMVGVEYLVGDEVVTETVEIEVDSTLTVTAKATAGYVLADDATASWSFDYVPTVVTPEAPTQDENVVTIPAVAGVEYSVGDETMTGVVLIPVDSTLTVTAKATAGYVLADDATASWSFDYIPTEVAPAAPTRDGNVISIPTVTGVEYLVGDSVVTGTVSIDVDSTVIVTARATAGYVLADDAVASWEFEYVVPPKPVYANFFYIYDSWADDMDEDARFIYGREGDEIFVGDWDGDGEDTLAVRRGKTFYVMNELVGGNADSEFMYGRVGDEVLVGDWDGDGEDTFAVRRGKTFYVMNELVGGNADSEFMYGRVGDEVLVGDWDGDGEDTFAVRRGKTFYVMNELIGGNADSEFMYGREGDEVFVGNWDGKPGDTFAVRRGDTFYLNDQLIGGVASNNYTIEVPAEFRNPDDAVFLVGDWDGDGIDTLAINGMAAK